jgi:chemotaxis response regulator CheB
VTTRDIIVFGGSAGSHKPLQDILSQLPKTLHAAIFVVIHRGQVQGLDYLPSIIGRSSELTTSLAQDGERFARDHIYVAPPRAHLLIDGGLLRVRPGQTAPIRSVDALFNSAARAYADRVIGVLLSGTLDDGTEGCWRIRRHGGVTIAQDPSEAIYPSMPQSAMRSVPLDYCLPASEIAAKLLGLVKGGTPPPPQQTARVMIVEDEWLLASELECQLTDLGYEVVAALPSGEEAISRVEGDMPDIVIMDVRLSGEMKGTEAAARIWEEFHIPIVFLTARADQETLSAAQASMPYAFLTKPHNTVQLHSAIQLALGRREHELSSSERSKRVS